MTEYISIGSTRNRQFYGIVRSSSLGNELLGRLEQWELLFLIQKEILFDHQ
jgi:hypothetical protein